MRPEFRDQLLATLDQVSQAIGGHTFPEAIDAACQLFENLLSLMRTVRTRDQFVAALEPLEVAPDEEQFALAAVAIIPQVIVREFGNLAVSAKKDFPMPTGRKQSLAPTEQAQVCAYVLELFGKGVALNICQKRAAQHFGVSERTVQRAWRNRATLENAAKMPSPEDAMKWLHHAMHGSNGEQPR